jgi:trehalose/maltose hydrolase-like predicted phosphorylase
MTPGQVIGPDGKVVAVLCGAQEQHISADVAYAVWQYWQATADEGFLRDAGAEILLEIARFWSSRARPEADGQGHVRGVIGPDEYHETIDDNAFTNVMARWSIRRGLDASDLLRTRWPGRWAALAGQIGIDDAELASWRNAADTMATGFDRQTGLFEQFAGYFALEKIDLADYASRSVPMDVVLGRARTQASQVVKQADVIALLCLLPDEFPDDSAAANFRYYAPRCSHGSSLSRAMHGVAAARLGDCQAAVRYLQETADIDLGDAHAAIDGGVHIAALGGIWMIAVLGFAGVALRPDGLAIHPQLPAQWRSLAFCVQWRGRRLRIRIGREGADHWAVEAILESGDAMTLWVSGKARALRPGEPADPVAAHA